MMPQEFVPRLYVFFFSWGYGKHGQGQPYEDHATQQSSSEALIQPS